MATIRIENGFLDLNQTDPGLILVGTLLTGDIKSGDSIAIDKNKKIRIDKVEIDNNTIQKKTRIRLYVKEDDSVIWHKLFYNIFEITSSS